MWGGGRRKKYEKRKLPIVYLGGREEREWATRRLRERVDDDRPAGRPTAEAAQSITRKTCISYRATRRRRPRLCAIRGLLCRHLARQRGEERDEGLVLLLAISLSLSLSSKACIFKEERL